MKMNHSGDLGESKLTHQMNAPHKEEGGVAFKATQSPHCESKNMFY